MTSPAILEDQQSEWTRCAWCWTPLPPTPHHAHGHAYCDTRCARRDTQPPDEAPIPVTDDQLSLEAI